MNTWGIGARVESLVDYPVAGVNKGDVGTVTVATRGGAVRVTLDKNHAGRWFSADQLRAAS